MKLTKRQGTFINNLLDLYKEAQEPIHYTELAERLGVSRFTAYDMLRVLEEKGFVRSEYRLPREDKTGRSERVFLPTEYAIKFISALTEEIKEYSWESIKDRLLKLIQSGEFDNLDIGPELLARVPPDNEDDIQYCIEVVTIMALHARHSEVAKTMRHYFIKLLPASEISHRAYLSLFGGFALGVLANKNFEDEEWMQELISHTVRFQELVINFSESQGQQFVEGLRQHFNDLFILFPEEGIDIEHLNKIIFKQEKD